MSYSVENFLSREALDRGLCARVEAILQAAIDERGSAFCVVSGGSTPLGFFRQLSTAKLDFSKVTFGLVDERWVSPDHDDSNERAVRSHLLQGAANSAEFVPLFGGGPDAGADAAAADQIFKTLPTFDVVLLGLGLDAHTASLFPGAVGLQAALEPGGVSAVAALQPPAAPHTRLTLTAARLINTRHLFLQATSAEKLEVLSAAAASEDALSMPISWFLNQQLVPLQVFWAP